MLALFEVSGGVEQVLLSWDGERMLVVGQEGTDREALLGACEIALEGAGKRPTELPAQAALRAWTERDDRQAWLPPSEVWRLSYSEAERFADRLLAHLQTAVGASVAPLRPLLVQSFFESLRPGDGGPRPTAWPPGASIQVRRQAILAEAARHLSPGQWERARAVLSDAETVRAVVSGPGEE